MIKKVKASLSEKILLIFLILLGIIFFSFFFITKNKCFFVEKIHLEKIKLSQADPIKEIILCALLTNVIKFQKSNFSISTL